MHIHGDDSQSSEHSLSIGDRIRDSITTLAHGREPAKPMTRPMSGLEVVLPTCPVGDSFRVCQHYAFDFLAAKGLEVTRL